MSASSTATPGSWAPLAEPLFRTLWIATLIANTGTWTQDMAASWMMISATDSPLLVSLMQGAASLPYLLFAFPAGVLADSLNQRTMLVTAAFFVACVSALMAGLSLVMPIAPWMLLLYVFAMGAGGAFYYPVWKGVVPQLVKPELQTSAFGLDGVSVNLARALGPAIAGILIGLQSPSLALAFNALSFIALALLLLRWTPEVRTVKPISATAFVSSLRTGIQFARFSPAVLRILSRSLMFLLPASVMWALLPLIGRKAMGLSSGGYGMLVGSVGLGAIAVIGLMPRLKSRLGTEGMMFAGNLCFIANLAALAYIPHFGTLCATMALAGAGWILVLSNLQASLLPATPTWVRGRVIAIYSLTFFGGVSAGSIVWGFIAQLSSPQIALTIALLTLAVTATCGLFLTLPSTGSASATPSPPLPLATMTPVFSETLDIQGEGPIAVYNDYQVPPQNRAEFLEKVIMLGRIRRKNGAYQWGIFEDLENPALQKERFMVSSRTEYGDQNDRISDEDQAVLSDIIRLTVTRQPPAQRYFRLEAIN